VAPHLSRPCCARSCHFAAACPRAWPFECTPEDTVPFTLLLFAYGEGEETCRGRKTKTWQLGLSRLTSVGCLCRKQCRTCARAGSEFTIVVLASCVWCEIDPLFCSCSWVMLRCVLTLGGWTVAWVVSGTSVGGSGKEPNVAARMHSQHLPCNSTSRGLRPLALLFVALWMLARPCAPPESLLFVALLLLARPCATSESATRAMAKRGVEVDTSFAQVLHVCKQG